MLPFTLQSLEIGTPQKIDRIAIISHYIPSCAQGDVVDFERVYGGLEAYIVASLHQLLDKEIYWIGYNPIQKEEVRILSCSLPGRVSLKFVSLSADKTMFSKHESYWREYIWLPMHGFRDYGRNQKVEEFWQAFSEVQDKLSVATARVHRFIDFDHVLVLDMQSCLVGQKLIDMLENHDVPNTTLFLPIPFPQRESFLTMPNAYAISKGLSAYSNVCLQTEQGKRNIIDVMKNHLRPYQEYHITPCFIPKNLLPHPEFPGNYLIRQDKINVTWAGRVDPSKCPVQALKAIDIVLLDEDNQKKMNFIFVGQSTGHSEGLYRECQESVANLCSQLKNKYPESFSFVNGLSRHELLAVLQESDACLVNSYADGFNIIAVEFLYLKQGKIRKNSKSKPFGLILSENTGVYDLLRNAIASSLILKEPDDPASLAGAISSFIQMDYNQCLEIFRQELDSLENACLLNVFDVVFNECSPLLAAGYPKLRET